ncbi:MULTISPECIES: hypothetical protein [Lysinibacillus]|uniref:hypothetical protein n=1 Tax=Lysinibacillus TaxID=400634 RepID=UPI00214B544A|nr:MULTISPECIES: hypothetical protein [Lysinibacillus]UUV26391.1 hypothetical protein NP781_07245 [Lysinibacillus sp. FN11]UYB49272.1 hypothetical protein OCI51_09995 [Lysinibacillus capsici]
MKSKEEKSEIKLSKILDKIGMNNPNEIIQDETFAKLVDNFSKLPKESLESVLKNIPNFQELAKQYMENLNISYNKIVDDLIEEKKILYKMLEKDNISDNQRVEIMNEIRSIRRTILMKDTIYNVQNNKVFQLGVGAIITIAGALIVKERKN